MNKIIEVSGLKKSYGDIHAVKGIDFYVEEGKLFAFLGPNGAGKSTTIDILCTLLSKDAGSVSVGGHVLGGDDDAIRGAIGVVFQDSLLDDDLTVEENLRTRGSFYGKKGAALNDAISNASNIAGVADLLKRPYGKLSGGQKRRCDIARALVNTPKVLFLDEPTTGLDPQTRRHMWDTITDVQRRARMTIFLTTHYMEEAAKADYVIVIDDGRIAARGTPAELKERYTQDRLSLICADIEKVCGELDEAGIAYKLMADQVIVGVATTLDALPVIERCRAFISGFEVVSGTMDDAFIAITGKEMRA